MTAIAPVITIDGPSGAGKGTLCKAMAEALQWHLLDSGAIYRVLALAALHHHVDLASEDALVPLASHLDVRFVSTDGNTEVITEGEDVSGEIRTQEVANAASGGGIRVREALLRRQRAFREARFNRRWTRYGDRGLPDAPVKFSLTPPRRNVRIDVCYSCRRMALVLTLNAFWPRSRNATIAIVIAL